MGRALRALVTGGGGFLGRAIVERLLADGHSVTVLGRRDYPELRACGVALLRADVADRPAVAAAVRGQDTVFHAAAKAGVWGERREFEDTNVRGTAHVVAACLESGVPRLVYTSSPSVVFDGRDQVDAGNELPYPVRYENVYSETKAEAERLVLAANGKRLATIALRPHLVYGPRDPHLVPRVLARARARRLVMVGDGANLVSLTYVDNAADAHLKAAARLGPGAPAAGKAYFVCDAAPVALWPWLGRLLAGVGLRGPRTRIPLPLGRALGAAAEAAWSALRLAGEPPLTRFVAAQLARSHTYSLEPARRDLGYEPPVTGEAAFDATLRWWKGQEPPA